MNKILALLLCIVFLISLCSCSTKSNTHENPYRPVSYKSEVLQDGVLTEWILEEYQYDENGFQIGSVQYLYGIPEATYIYENDEFGNILKVTCISDDKATIFDHKLTLDDHGRILLQEAYTDDVLCYIMAYTYDKNGNVTSEIYTTMEDGTANVIRNKEMTYNRKGEQIREILRKEDGSYIRYDYEDGKEVKASTYGSNDELLSYREYLYNDKGQLVKEASYTCQTDGDSRTSLLSTYDLYTYDDTGLVVTKTNHSVEERPVQTHSITTYDEYGNQLVQERYMDGQLDWRITQTFEPIP